MATKTQSQSQTAATTDPVATEPVATDLVQLLEQQRQLNEHIKRLKAAQPQPTPLERVVAKQTAQYGRWVAVHLMVRTIARTRAGQNPAEALRDVTAFYVAQAEHLLAEQLAAAAAAAASAEAETESDH